MSTTTAIKRLIVSLAMRRMIPMHVADWLVSTMGLGHV